LNNTFQRCEIKYLLHETAFQNLTAVLAGYMEADGNCSADSTYHIYNIYFDTENDDIIRRSLAKPYYKEKLRLRSYTIPHSESDRVFLELKKKIGGVVCKRRAEMRLDEANRFVATGQAPAGAGYLDRQVISEIAYFLRCYPVAPRVAINYQRMAFYGREDRDLRITFDTNIRTRRHSLALVQGGGGRDLLEECPYLMEIKTVGALPLWLARVLSTNGVYRTSFSKYGTEYKRYLKERSARVLEMPRASFCQPLTQASACCVNL